MSAEAWFLVVLLVVALVAMARGMVRVDLAAVLILVALVLPWRPTDSGWVGILELTDGLSGFGSPAVAMIASMFVLSAAMERTGAASLVGRRVLAAGASSELRLQLTVLTAVTIFSAFVSDTTTVLVFLPLVLNVCRERGYAPSRILLPLAFASLLGGQWTLIGTRSNVIASDFLRAQTGEGLGFGQFTPVALCVWGGAMIFFVLIGRRFLPHGEIEPSLADRYDVQEYLTEVLASPGSELIGRTLASLALRDEYGVTVLGVVRGEERLAPSPALILGPNDVLIVQGRISGIASLLDGPGMSVREELELGDRTLRSVDLRMVEALVAPQSALEGYSLADTDLPRRYDVSVLAVGHRGRSLSERPLQHALRAGDSVLFVGHEDGFERMRSDPRVLLLESRPLPTTGRSKAPIVLGLMAFVVLASATRLLEPALAVMVAAVAAVLTRCLALREAYRAIDWRVVMVLGGMIPFGLALESTGTAHVLAGTLARGSSELGPWPAFALLLLITIVLTQLIENAAAAAILAPIAFELARAAGADPEPFLLGMAICTSGGFCTPWAHESTLLVFGPGRYRMSHYLALGLPFTLITWVVTALVVPLLHPLAG